MVRHQRSIHSLGNLIGQDASQTPDRAGSVATYRNQLTGLSEPNEIVDSAPMSRPHELFSFDR